MPSRARIFLVDDHPLVREWLASQLGQQPDLQVCGQAENAAQALAAMKAAPPDIAVVDVTLEGRSGLDLIDDLRAAGLPTAVVVYSMHEESHYAERALRAGARAYVMKRESTGQIIEAIRQVRAGGIYAAPEILARLAQRMVGRTAPPPRGAAAALTERELEVFRRLGQGLTTRRVAAELGLSVKTVQAFCARMKEKLGVATAAELVREAVRWVEAERRMGHKPPH